MFWIIWIIAVQWMVYTYLLLWPGKILLNRAVVMDSNLLDNLDNCGTSEWYMYTDGAGPRSAVGRASDLRDRDPGHNTRSGHILSILLPLIQEGQLQSLPNVCAHSTG